MLLAPISPELADLITNDHVRMVMTELRKTYDYVVVDTSCHLADFNLEVIESAQHILVVTALTIPAIKDAKLALKVLESLTVDPASVLLVVDRSDAHSDFNKDSIEQNLRHSVGAQIPYDPRVVGDSINRGTPFVTASPESDISRSIRELAGALVPGWRPARRPPGVGAAGRPTTSANAGSSAAELPGLADSASTPTPGRHASDALPPARRFLDRRPRRPSAA